MPTVTHHVLRDILGALGQGTAEVGRRAPLCPWGRAASAARRRAVGTHGLQS